MPRCLCTHTAAAAGSSAAVRAVAAVEAEEVKAVAAGAAAVVALPPNGGSPQEVRAYYEALAAPAESQKEVKQRSKRRWSLTKARRAVF